MCSRISRNLFHFSRILRRPSCTYTRTVAERLLLSQTRKFSSDNSEKKLTNEDSTTDEEHNLTGDVATKYQIFRDEDAPIIFDVDEERKKINIAEFNDPRERPDAFKGLNLERGVRGVFDIEDLVDILRKDNAQDIFVASVPPELVYVDYIVIVTGKSLRHMKALSDFVRRAYKKKRVSGDKLPRIEGKNSADWIALDLGNIVLHVFSEDARANYDLETLWTVGSKYDDASNEPIDKVSELLSKHSDYLAGLQPANRL